MRLHGLCLSLLVVGILWGDTRADNWPSWRGPEGQGVTRAAGPFPTRWTADEGIAWVTELPGPGNSTPAVWNDQIFLTCERDGDNLAICLDRDGQQRWAVPVGKYKKGKHPKASGCNPSPVTDGEHVVFYFKSGDLACLDYDGNVVWATNLQARYGEDDLWWDLGTSPVMSGDRVFVTCVQSGPSYVVAFDKSTGEELWKQDRRLPAPLESNQSYTTPCLVRHDGQEQIVVLGADHVTAHDTATGEEVWRVGGLNPDGHKMFRSIASPVVAGNLLLAPYARGETLTAIRLGGKGDVTDSHVAWMGKASADVPTPATQDGRAYICSDRGVVTCLDVATGEVVWSREPEPNRKAYSASPILADGHLYVTREDGTTFVLSASDGELLSTNEVGEFVAASPVFVDGRILLRARDRLYCMGE